VAPMAIFILSPVLVQYSFSRLNISLPILLPACTICEYKIMKKKVPEKYMS